MRELTYRAPGTRPRPRRPRGQPQTPKDRAFVIFFTALFLIGCVWLGFILVSEGVANQTYQNAKSRYADRVDGALQIDWTRLQSQNPDIIAWIDIPDTPISYPVLKGSDDREYLRTTYQHKYNILGSIFVSQYNRDPFGDENTLIYGHNSHGKSMFGTLKSYLNSPYAERHSFIYIYRPGGIREQYKVISAQRTTAGSDVYTVRFKDAMSFLQWRIKMNGASAIGTELNPDNDNRTITLSTCASGGKGSRTVVIAQLVGSEKVASQAG